MNTEYKYIIDGSNHWDIVHNYNDTLVFFSQHY